MFNSVINYLTTQTPLLYLTQSLWRDEAFSVLLSEPGGMTTVRLTASDYNPPLYYLLLHSWMGVFGKSEMALRALSLLFYLIFIIFFHRLVKTIFKNHAMFPTLLAAINPMIIYYALEARMYSLYYLLTTASMYYFYSKKWRLYILVTVLALYTHPYTAMVPFLQGIYLFVSRKLNKDSLKVLITPFIFYIPWMFVIFDQLKRTKEMWMYAVDANLITAVLGNLFIGFEGTPHFLWRYMKILSFFLILIFVLALKKLKKNDAGSLLMIWVFLPLFVVLSISLVKPIYVNRYLITVTVAQILLVTASIRSLKNKTIQKVANVIIFSVSVFFLFYLPPYIKKVDIRSVFMEINKLSDNNDLIYAQSPLVYFESLYYSSDRSKVFLYNPDKVSLPNYLGVILIGPEKQLNSLPRYPYKAYMVKENGSFEIYSTL